MLTQVISYKVYDCKFKFTGYKFQVHSFRAFRMNSRGMCWIIMEAALWVADLLKNEITQHPLDHPLCSLIYFLGSFVIMHNTIIENTSKTQFLKSNGESDQSQGWVSIYILTEAFLMTFMSPSRSYMFSAT